MAAASRRGQLWRLCSVPKPRTKGFNNTAYVGVDFGFEVQIDELARPDGADIHRTGAVYGQPGQNLNLQAALPVGQWNTYQIHVHGQVYTVRSNGVQVTQFNNPNAGRGRRCRHLCRRASLVYRRIQVAAWHSEAFGFAQSRRRVANGSSIAHDFAEEP